jgi:Ca2+-binding EF-hand superfamily protein
MATLRANFEKEIRNKLSQKSSSKQSEEQILLKSFKFFDLNNNGQVEFDEFVKAIEKIGVQNFKESQLQELFEIYDESNDGAVDYKEFSNGVFGLNQSAQTETSRPTTASSTKGKGNEAMEALCEKVKGILAKRGPGGILGLGKQFRIADKNKSGDLDKGEFVYGMRDFGCGLSDDESGKLFDYFDKDKGGSIDYNEFLVSIRGKMNSKRRALVNQAFDIIDADKSGELTIDDLRGVYNAKQHPDVKAGKKTEEQVLTEFLKTFECMYDVYRIDDDNVTRDEFLEYYNFVSASIDNDQYFELMMNNAWRINEGKDKAWGKKGWSNKDEEPTSTKAKSKPTLRDNGSPSKEEAKAQTRPSTATPSNKNQTDSGFGRRGNEAMEALCEKVRGILAKRGPGGIIGLGKQFRIADKNKSGDLDKGEFIYGMRDFGCGLSDDESGKLFDFFDRDKGGSIDYNEFLVSIRGKMNSKRRALVNQAFDIIDADKSGELTIDDLRGVYNAKQHPDVKAGKKTEEQVLNEFLKTFENMYDVYRIDDDKVTRDEFIEYYNFVSASIDNDQYFELMMNNAWRINEGKDKAWGKKGWSNKDDNPTSAPAQNTNARGKASPQQESKVSVAAGGKIQNQQTGSTPWGTSVETTEYTTSSRPQTAQAKGSDAKGGDALIDAFRKKILARGARGMLGLSRLFKIIDDNNSKSLDLSEFNKCCKDFRLEFPESDVKKLFKVFDRNNDGDIDYDEFLRAIRGPMVPNRVKLVKQAFNKIDKDGSGVLDMDDIRGVYNAKNHPDVKAGKKTEDEILGEFLDTFEQHHAISTGDFKMRDGRVSLEEFLEYYNNISMSIDDDKYFELMIKNAWNLDNNTYKKGWRDN